MHTEPTDDDDVADLSVELERIAVAVAVDAARHVAERTVAATGDAPAGIDSKSSSTDLVTDVDRSTEARLIAAIRSHRPNDSVLGEESGSHAGAAGSSHGEVEWVIDPIDGTVNFVLGLPVFSVSVGARVQGRTLAGCVVDVSRMEVFHARLGGGSWVGPPDGPSRRLGGPRGVALSNAVVATGFAYDARVRSRQGAVLAALLGRVGNIRRLGSAALDLCYVAAGRVDAYFEGGLKEWDRAAGMLVVGESGARVGVLAGHGGEITLAADVAGYDDLLAILTELNAADVFAAEN